MSRKILQKIEKSFLSSKSIAAQGIAGLDRATAAGLDIKNNMKMDRIKKFFRENKRKSFKEK